MAFNYYFLRIDADFKLRALIKRPELNVHFIVCYAYIMFFLKEEPFMIAFRVIFSSTGKSYVTIFQNTTSNFAWISYEIYSGAPRENIVQNHLNIALLNVF